MEAMFPATQETPATIFERERARLTSLAYGILGSLAEAEDAVQDTYLRFRPADKPIENPEGWLTTVVSRISIDRLRSAQRRREVYPGEWLPEPVLRAPQEQDAITRSRLSIAFLRLLEKLEPEQRAAFVMREVFDYAYREIGQLMGKSEAASRQIVARARAAFARDRVPGEQPETASGELVGDFMEALASGDEKKLLRLLASDATLTADGGGKVPSALNTIYGAERIIRFFVGIAKKRVGEYSLLQNPVNSEPGLLVYSDGRLAGIMAFSAKGGSITGIYAVSNPDKLRTATHTLASINP